MENPITVLIVDDESFIRQSLVDYFEDQLWQSIQAESAEKAIELLKIETPDCAIVDVRMGGMDGNMFIREAIKMNSNLVYIICTGSPEYEVPPDLKKISCVSSHLFKKPITDMNQVKEEFIKLINSNKNNIG